MRLSLDDSWRVYGVGPIDQRLEDCLWHQMYDDCEIEPNRPVIVITMPCEGHQGCRRARDHVAQVRGCSRVPLPSLVCVFALPSRSFDERMGWALRASRRCCWRFVDGWADMLNFIKASRVPQSEPSTCRVRGRGDSMSQTAPLCDCDFLSTCHKLYSGMIIYRNCSMTLLCRCADASSI